MNCRFWGRAVILATALVFLPVQAAFAQTQNLPPNLRTTPRNPDEAAYRQIQIQRTLDAQQRTAMKEMEDNARATAKFPGEKLPEMSEKDRRRIEALLAPDPEDLLTYKEFLDQDRTGIFRLFPNSDCETQGIIRIDGECQNHVPGGSSYSFRGRATTPDIFFNNGLLAAEGFFSQEVMTSLGDIAIEDVAAFNARTEVFVRVRTGDRFCRGERAACEDRERHRGRRNTLFQSGETEGRRHVRGADRRIPKRKQSC